MLPIDLGKQEVSSRAYVSWFNFKAGCAILISHDRWFLDRIATHILAFEGESRVVFIEGSYQDYEADRKARLGADTPVGAWAEFLRHEGIKDAANLVGVQRALWAVELPDVGYDVPKLAKADLTGSLGSYPACQHEAKRLRASGTVRLRAPSAALVASGARGWVADPSVRPAPTPRDGRVWVLFGQARDVVGWPAVESGAPSARLLPLVNHF